MDQFVEFEKEDIKQSIPSRFAQQVGRHSQRLAVKARDIAWTYHQLDAFANRIAHAIRRRRADKQEMAALLLDQGAPLVGAILGVLKAGKTYLSLDATHPSARLAWMLDDSEAALILTDSTNRVLAESLASTQRRVLDVDELAEGPPDHPLLSIPPDALAYIFYTSGSTGKPKGVVDTHRNVLHNVMRYTNHLRIAPSDRLTLLQSASFSGAVSSLFGALLNGASSFPFDLRRESPARLAAWLREERITIYHSVPMIFRSFLSDGLTFPSVRVIRLEGDASSKTDVELFRKHFVPPCVLANGLGATETGLSCQYQIRHDTELTGGTVPIGYPTTDMEVLLLDESGRTVGDDTVGEIAVRSEYLSPGYWKRPDLTAQAFAAGDNGKRIYRTGDMGRRRSDGCIEYLGRKDFQLKVRGHRVEPAEIESSLLSLDNVKEAAVATRPDSRGEPRLVAYVVAARKPAPSVPALRRALAKVLPGHMVPSAFVFLDALPLNDNRKVDRRALPSPEKSRAARSTPIVSARDDVERQLVAIWEDELGLAPLGVADDFFEWGGDSLAATRLMAGIEKAFGLSLAPATLCEAATIEQLACLIRTRKSSAGRSTLVPIQRLGAKPPLFCVHDLNGQVFQFAALARHLGEDQPLYGVKPVGLCNGEQPLPTFELMAARYLEDIRAVQPRGPYHLSGYCLGAVVAFEMARQLRSQGEPVGLLALLSISPLDFRPLMTPASWRRYRSCSGGEGFFERLRFHLGQARKLPAKEALGVVFAKAGLIPFFLGREARRRMLRLRRNGQLSGSTAPASTTNVAGAIRSAFQAYSPRPDSGRVVLILDQEAQQKYTPDAQGDYRGLTTGELVVHVIPGGEHAMMKEPGVHELAEHLRRHLDAG